MPLAEVAASVALSPSRLAHLLTAEMGLPARRYLLWLRLGDAIGELARGASITEAAHAAGFAGAHFSRTFRRMLGFTPSDAMQFSKFRSRRASRSSRQQWWARVAYVRRTRMTADSTSNGTVVRVRKYGTSGSPVIVLHGGPGAPGYTAPVARRLADSLRVFEPLQHGSGAQPLTVARHVADLHELVERRCAEARAALVCHSWGAMLALSYAAAHHDQLASLVLIGSGNGA